jgi:hypothetical protein
VFGEAPISVDELAHGTRLTATRQVCRVRSASHRAVVKVVRVGPRDDAVSDPKRLDFAWREPLIYERGLPVAYVDAGIEMPRLLGRFEREDAVALWLEDLGGNSGSALTPNNYAQVALRLGRAHGRIAPGAAPDTFPWSHYFLRDYLASWSDAPWEKLLDDDAWAAPLIAANFTATDRRDLVRLCMDRDEMLSWATRLPQTICHHDVWPNNVFDFDDHTTLIDWSFAGYGHIGADVGNLVTDSCGDLLQPTSLLDELDAVSTAAYRTGLDEVGWTGDFRVVRLGICILAAKWSWLVPHMLGLAAHDSHGVYGATAVDSHRLFSERAAMLRFFARLADEARSLADSLGM